MRQRRVKATGFTLYPEDVEIIDRANIGEAGRSATLRRIIREWAAIHQPERMLVDTPGEYMTAQVGE